MRQKKKTANIIATSRKILLSNVYIYKNIEIAIWQLKVMQRRSCEDLDPILFNDAAIGNSFLLMLEIARSHTLSLLGNTTLVDTVERKKRPKTLFILSDWVLLGHNRKTRCCKRKASFYYPRLDDRTSWRMEQYSSKSYQ